MSKLLAIILATGLVTTATAEASTKKKPVPMRKHVEQAHKDAANHGKNGNSAAAEAARKRAEWREKEAQRQEKSAQRKGK